ncbi:Bug family tripartite tricarboxylate transporter substrate binding protein [Ottowia thiooxydans]|uniref:Bug family tripartite tricarboxylate transporter substrate binding protein n=1 Tax=Ottowia thiooxydans TaxID=219182 RepID=UPI000417A5BC|nr:tripartite tricarboxylate transporter substrate binding protein [Ottowia thiooxydans]
MLTTSSIGLRVLRGAALISLVACTTLAMAQSAPNQFSIVVPYAPGGPADAAARLIRPVFESALGKTTIVENLAGAGGSIGATKVLRAVDGSQILMGSPNEVILAPLGLSAVKYKPDDFRLVGTVGELPYVLIARPDFPAGTVDELIAYSKANAARPLSYGSMGSGSINHLATEAFGTKTGVRLNHIPYKGAAPLVQDVASGQIDFAFTPLAGPVQGLIDTGKVKFYGLTSAARSARWADWPTVNEGKVLKDFVYSIWVGPVVSKSTPEAAVQRINAALAEALRQPDVSKGLAAAGFLATGTASLLDAQKLYTSEADKFRNIADAIKLQPQ